MTDRPHTNAWDLVELWTCFRANTEWVDTLKIWQHLGRGQWLECYHEELVMFLCSQNGKLTEKGKEVLRFVVVALVVVA